MRQLINVQGEDCKASDVQKCIEVQNLNHNFIFGDATYFINRNRQTKLRKPDSLPLESDVKNLRDFTIKDMQELTNGGISSAQEYIRLRDLTASRLTLFNGRRGGEPARLLLSEWEAALNDGWLNSEYQEKLDEIERRVFRNNKVTFQTG